jgi:hypothetical protein
VVVGARTQPPLSCMMMAKMKRLSTPDALAAAPMPASMPFISSSVLSGCWHCWQEVLIVVLLLLNLVELSVNTNRDADEDRNLTFARMTPIGNGQAIFIQIPHIVSK